jgi:putative RNA 2'-phosphotransferase
VVAENNKQRFRFSDDGQRIRANQGHSIPIEGGLKAVDPPEILYRGTATRFLDSIKAQGLLKRERHHVHFSANHETATAVGRRHGRPIVLAVRAATMCADGHPFFISDNGVWLVDHVPPQYFDIPG